MNRTDLLLQSLLGVNMVLLEFVVEFLEGLEILDRDTHLLNFLDKMSERRGHVEYR